MPSHAAVGARCVGAVLRVQRRWQRRDAEVIKDPEGRHEHTVRRGDLHRGGGIETRDASASRNDWKERARRRRGGFFEDRPIPARSERDDTVVGVKERIWVAARVQKVGECAAVNFAALKRHRDAVAPAHRQRARLRVDNRSVKEALQDQPPELDQVFFRRVLRLQESAQRRVCNDVVPARARAFGGRDGRERGREGRERQGGRQGGVGTTA